MEEKKLYDLKSLKELRIGETIGATQTIKGKGITRFSMTLAGRENGRKPEYHFIKESGGQIKIICVEGVPAISKKGLLKLDDSKYSLKESEDNNHRITLAKAKAVSIEDITCSFSSITPKSGKTIIKFLENGGEKYGIFMGRRGNYQEGNRICMTPLSTDYGVLISENKKPTAVLLRERGGEISLVDKIEVGEDEREYSKFNEDLHREGLHNL